jgi:hypothetical protein
MANSIAGRRRRQDGEKGAKVVDEQTQNRVKSSAYDPDRGDAFPRLVGRNPLKRFDSEK